jgi:hypothetical protein
VSRKTAIHFAANSPITSSQYILAWPATDWQQQAERRIGRPGKDVQQAEGWGEEAGERRGSRTWPMYVTFQFANR